jgi:hypothetical protein
MSVLSRLRPALLLAAIAAAAPAALGADPAAAPTEPASTSAASGFSDRLFLAFFQEAALVPSQWWEGQVEYDDGSSDIPVNALLLRGVVAFKPYKSLEVGGRVGFGTTHASGAGPDGTGATDLDAYGKWVFADAVANTDFSAGVIFTVPTGDDTAGLGFNSFASQAFGGVRYRLEHIVLGGHVGVRINGDGRFQGVPLPGKTSFELGASALFLLASEVSIVGEAQVETERFENVDAATQLLVGVNWMAFRRGMFRAAIAGGLTDGAPNFRALLGYAYTF